MTSVRVGLRPPAERSVTGVATLAESSFRYSSGMTIPAVSWAALEPAAKRERLLAAAREVFAREGLDAPMPLVAAATGAGVGSLYRCYPSKRDLIAALVVQRLEVIRTTVLAALELGGDPWRSLCEVLRELAEQQAADELTGRAYELVRDDDAVGLAREATTDAFEELLAGARAAGRVRADACARDIHLLFAATRAARVVDGDGWRRVLELFIDSLRVGQTTATATL
jgi:AcrR family transcriptional regulator